MKTSRVVCQITRSLKSELYSQHSISRDIDKWLFWSHRSKDMGSPFKYLMPNLLQINSYCFQTCDINYSNNQYIWNLTITVLFCVLFITNKLLFWSFQWLYLWPLRDMAVSMLTLQEWREIVLHGEKIDKCRITTNGEEELCYNKRAMAL